MRARTQTRAQFLFCSSNCTAPFAFSQLGRDPKQLQTSFVSFYSSFPEATILTLPLATSPTDLQEFAGTFAVQNIKMLLKDSELSECTYLGNEIVEI